MSETFDPYRVWLSIPPGNRPPTHYQLLGISPDEQDPTVINAAVMRQSAYVRNFQIGKHAEEAARILSEIQAAKACLLDPAKRTRYDAELRATRTSSDTPAPARVPLVEAAAPAIDLEALASAALAVPADRSSPPSHRLRAKLSKSPKNAAIAWQIPAAVFAGVLVVVALIALALPPGEPAVDVEEPMEVATDDAVQTLAESGLASATASDGQSPPEPAPRADTVSLDSREHAHSPSPRTNKPRDRTKDWSYGYGLFDPAKNRVTEFTHLPHFTSHTPAGRATGPAWQGSAKIPDQRLGWLILMDCGGHPDERYAVIRRWTSPVDGTLSVNGTMTHGAEPHRSDGVRGRVVAGDGGMKGEWSVCARSVRTEVPTFYVAANETIDFVVDCLAYVDCDGFDWPVTLELKNKSGEIVGTWDSVADFAGPAWSYGYGAFDAEKNRISNFDLFPLFIAGNWRATASRSDPMLGWAQISREGGHPGGDQRHAVIRRWTAPATGRLSLTGELTKSPAAGLNEDGIRARIVASGRGLKGEWLAHGATVSTNVEQFDVSAGETLDFVVDCLSNCNNDGFGWSVRIELKSAQNIPLGAWDSLADFGGPGTLVAARQPPPRAAVDLLALIDPVRDAVKGKWRRDGSALVGEEVDNARLEIRYGLPVAYRLILMYEPHGNRELVVGLPTVDGKVELGIDVPGDRYFSGLWSKERQLAVEVAGAGRRLVQHQPNEIVCEVEPGFVHIYCNGALTVDWMSDGRPSAMHDNWSTPDPARLMIGAHDGHVIHALRLEPLSGHTLAQPH